MDKQNKEQPNIRERPPVVVIMGHIDHGKSTLLDYIRKTNVVDGEVGGITQNISAYEVTHKNEEGKTKKITFLDTPGHEAFSNMRECGGKVADVAILIVSAEDGVKPQTLEAWKTIVGCQTPVVVAINKIDKPGSNVEKTKNELVENEIYLEGYGGKIPFALISAKTGEGVDNLLSLIDILALMENFTGDSVVNANGFVVETNLDSKRGIEASLIIKDGTLKNGMTVVVEDSFCTARVIEDFLGHTIKEATFSSPVKLFGWSKMPKVGSPFISFMKKNEAAEYIENWSSKGNNGQNKYPLPKENSGEAEKFFIPILLKADTAGSLEALEKEIAKIKSENALFKIIKRDAGPISENDIKQISADTVVIAFNVKTDKSAVELAEKKNIKINFFNIIYKMTEWLETEMERLRPKVETLETTAKAKIIKTFSRTKERQIVGGKVIEGSLGLDKAVKIMRRDFEIGRGKIVNLEKGKTKVSSVEEGSEFGMMLESKIEIAPNDIIESFSITQK
ncbi:translation initiation factor IF-2 [Candidatus Nomurabacteria bacterium]|nr:translation initiation factor IF-2 [Candidatus Nomurabacteria bacterium]